MIKLKEILKEAGDVDIASVKQDLEKNLKRAGFRVKKFKQSKPGYNEVWSGAFYTNKAILPMSVDKYGSVFYDSTNIGKLNRGKKVIDYLKSIKSSNKWIESVNEDGHTDVASAKRKAMLMVEYSNKLLNKLNGMNKEDSLPSWLSDKITIAQTNLSKSSDYLNNPVESVNEFRDKREADTARDQIGNKALYMIGAKDFVFGTSGGKKSLVFKIMRNSKGVSHIRMRLSSMDLYDMEFLAIRAGKVKIKSKEKGVYGDQLGVMIKKNTGLNIRL